MKKSSLLLLGGAAVGGYLLYRRSQQQAAPAMAGLLWDTPSEAAAASRAELVPLYEKYNAKVGSLPVELAKINPTRYNEAFAVVDRIYREDILAGDKLMAQGEIVKAKTFFDNGIQELTNLRLPEIDALLASAPAAIAEYNAKIASATTAAQQKVVTEEARKLSQAETVKQAREAGASLASQNAILEELDKPLAAAQKGLEFVGAPLGITAGKGFFENMSDFATRMKWYAIAGLGIYAAIKFGPTLLASLKARQASKLARASIPSLAGEPQGAYVLMNPRRKSRR